VFKSSSDKARRLFAQVREGALIFLVLVLWFPLLLLLSISAALSDGYDKS
jgi:hypothetical protein